MVIQVRRPDDYDAKRVTDLGPSEPSASLNSLVLSQLKRPPPPPPAPVLPAAPAPALPSATAPGPAVAAAPASFAPAVGGDVEDGEVGNAVVVTRVLKLEHMVSLFCHRECSAHASSIRVMQHFCSCCSKVRRVSRATVHQHLLLVHLQSLPVSLFMP